MEQLAREIQDKIDELKSRSMELQRDVKTIEDEKLDLREYKRIQDALNQTNRRLEEALYELKKVAREI